MNYIIKNMVLVALFVCGMVATSNATIWYVDNGGGNNNGVSIFPTLQAALSQPLQPGDEIWVKSSNTPYTPSNNPSFFFIPDSVKILGGFKPGNNWNVRDWQLYPTYLQSAGNGTPIFVNIGNSSSLSLLDGFILRNGNAINGGAVFNDGSRVTFENCRFENCHASNYGGAIYNKNGKVTFNNCTFRDCTADFGGAMYNDVVQNVHIRGCVFESCSTIHLGGAICDVESILTLENSLFRNNRGSIGGAIFGRLSQWVLENNQFENNWAVDWSGYHGGEGGALYYAQCNVQAVENKFIGNLAIFRGGAIVSIMSTEVYSQTEFTENYAEIGSGIYTQFSDTRILRSIFHDNGSLSPITVPGTALSFSSFEGGAIYVDGEKGGRAILENLLITDNQAKYGAGVYNNKIKLNMTHLTITLNEGGYGAGFYYVDHMGAPQYPAGHIKCLNSIIFGNIGSTSDILTDNVDNTGFGNATILADFNYCDIEGSSNWMTNILGNPNSGIDLYPDFVNFAPYNNGGDFQLNDTYYPSCIGEGTMTGVVDDLDNTNVRPYGPRPDIGCYENMNIWKNMVVHHEEEYNSAPFATTTQLQLYPNPVISGQPLTLEMSGYEHAKADVTIYNMLGMKLLQTNAANGINNVTLPTTAGTYFVRITTATGEVIGNEKITVQ